MARYITKRVLRSLITMFIIITILFALLRLMPVEGYFENYDKMSSTQIQVKLQTLGVTAPLPTQLVRFYKQVLHGDLGESNVYRKGVAITEIIAEKIPISLELGLISLCIALALGLPLGVIMARSTRTRFKIGDRLGTVFIVLVQAMPSAVYHILIQFLGSQTYVGKDVLGLPMLFDAAIPRAISCLSSPCPSATLPIMPCGCGGTWWTSPTRTISVWPGRRACQTAKSPSGTCSAMPLCRWYSTSPTPFCLP